MRLSVIPICDQVDTYRKNHFSCFHSGRITLAAMSFHSISELALGSDSGNWPNRGLAAWHIAAYRQGPNPSSMSAARNSFSLHFDRHDSKLNYW
jgi:hypothetical protein